jgi:hypothetical protein
MIKTAVPLMRLSAAGCLLGPCLKRMEGIFWNILLSESIPQKWTGAQRIGQGVIKREHSDGHGGTCL